MAKFNVPSPKKANICKSKSGNRYTSPNSTDLLARIPIPKNTGTSWFGTFNYINRHPEYNERIYFGPVKLSKFKVRLLTDKGFEVNLNLDEPSEKKNEPPTRDELFPQTER